MRFDDMIATVLARPSARGDQRAAQWRQLVDLLAQGRHGGSEEQVARAFEFLRQHRSDLPLALRQSVASALAGLPIDSQLLAFFAEDHPTVAASLLRGARLKDGEWLALLPSLSPTGRAVLRHRRDLPVKVQDALAGFGASDFVIESSADAEAAGAAASTAAPPAPPANGSQILELVHRIEAYQRERLDAESRYAVHADAIAEFRWETGPEGVILWVEGAPRGPLVGQSLAIAAGHAHQGVDGHAAGAFHKRAPFRDARFTVVGEGPAGGSWRISGVPFFDPDRGNFLGYRGTARRPRLDEVAPRAGDAEAGLFGSDLQPDSLRQLIHELRTPLNAIVGFAEMIEGQYMGPAGSSYRGRAADILEQAQRLLTAVDDLDTAARMETSRLELAPGAVELGTLLERVQRNFTSQSEGGAEVVLQVGTDLPPAAIEAAAAERMISRLLAVTIGLGQAGETIRLDLKPATRAGAQMLRLAVTRPRSIAGLDSDHLLQPGYSPDGDWPDAPALGLGFALRLVRKLAEAAGGTLNIGDDEFVLIIPAVAEAAEDAATNGSEGSA